MLKKTQYVDFQLVQTWPVGRVTAENYPFVLAFSRYDYGGIIASVNGFNNTPLWPRVKPLFEEYAITGFRFEYIPSNGRGMVFNSSATAISSGQLISECQIWEDINTYNIAGYTADQKKMCNGYQFFDAAKPMTVIRDNKPLARSQKSAWVPTTASESSANGLPEAGFAFGCTLSNTPVAVGHVKVTWYMTCRGLRPV